MLELYYALSDLEGISFTLRLIVTQIFLMIDQAVFPGKYVKLLRSDH